MSEESVRRIPDREVTRLLNLARKEPETFDQLIPLVYGDLRRIGHAQRRRLNATPTLQTTALVHEAFLKLRDRAGGTPIENRLHFRRLAAVVMRQLILDYARKKVAGKRGGGVQDEALDENLVAPDEPDALFVLQVEQAICNLEEANPRMAEMVSASYFAGYTNEEIAEIMKLSSRTVGRELRRARAWLAVELAD